MNSMFLNLCKPNLQSKHKLSNWKLTIDICDLIFAVKVFPDWFHFLVANPVLRPAIKRFLQLSIHNFHEAVSISMVVNTAARNNYSCFIRWTNVLVELFHSGTALIYIQTRNSGHKLNEEALLFLALCMLGAREIGIHTILHPACHRRPIQDHGWSSNLSWIPLNSRR